MCEIRFPYIQTNRHKGELLTRGPHLVGGLVLDPFKALINHSCDPNARFISEGLELHVRALKNIPAGAELTVSYTLEYYNSDYQEQQRYLSVHRSFRCTCSICKLGQLGPTGQLRARIQKFIDPHIEPARITLSYTNPRQRQDYVRNFATEQKALLAATIASGATPEAYPFPALYLKGFECAVLQANSPPEALKACLQIYFYHQPLQIEQLDVDARLGILSNIIVLMQMVYQRLSSEGSTFESFVGHLRAKLASDTEKWYGSDSKVARYERGYFLYYVQDRKKRTAAKGIRWDYVSLQDNTEERADFEKKITELAVWAKLPQWTLMDYVED
jgi:SET domain